MHNREDHGRNHSSGNDGPGVHVCHKCGWPFPNPHPSARHRRAHKKICGTIEGYKVLDSRGLSLSDDEHLSDEDQKTPSPQVLERSNDEIKSGGSGERTNKLEDETFVDAVTEFSDSGSAKGSSDDFVKLVRSIETSSMNDTKTFLSFEDDAITAVVPPSKGSADSSQDAESQGNTLSADAIDFENQPSHVTIGSMERPISDCRTEEFIDGKQSSICDSNPIQLESPGNVSPENLKKRAREDLSVIEVMENKDHNKKRNAIDEFMMIDTKGNEKGIQTSEATLDQVAAAGVIESNEQYNDELSLNFSSSEADSISSTQIKGPDTGEMASEGSGKLNEIANKVGEVNENFHVLSVPDDIPKLENPEILIEGYKDHRAGRMPQLTNNEVKPSNPFSSLTSEGEKPFASKDDIPQCQPLMCDTQECGNSEHAKDSVLKVSDLSFASGDSIQEEGEERENVVDKPLDGKEADNQGQIKEKSSVLLYTTADDSGGKMTMTPENHGIQDNHGNGSTLTPENAKNIVTSDVSSSEPELLNLNESSDSQDKGVVLVEDLSASVGDNDEILKSFDAQILPKPFDEQMTNLSPSNASSSIQKIDDLAKDCVEAGPENQFDEGENKLATQQLGASTTTDFSVDSGSQTDSLEAHWGSVSVLSTQSDMQAAAAEKADVEKPKTSAEYCSQENEKTEMFEPPSFMTLVEPTTKGDKAEIQRAQKEAQAGWFPSLTNVVNESQGRKKNEQMIAKVTNWTATKPHAPLKNLLTESNTANKSKENQPLQEPVKKDSPARYGADIKREKRKVKGRPYWAQFMCCSSVN